MEKLSQVFVQLLKKPSLIGYTSRRCLAEGVSSPAIPKSPSATTNLGDVPGLSSAVVKTPTGEVGPGASKTSNYKNPEYFSYDNTSYFEAEVEMAQHRLPQPSNKIPLTS